MHETTLSAVISSGTDVLCLNRSNHSDSKYNCTQKQNDPQNIQWEMLSMILIIVITAGGNILVCLAIKRDSRLQNMTNYFLMSLAICDLLVALLVMPFGMYIALYSGQFPLDVSICVVWASMDVLFCTASIWHMCMMSVDRYLTIKYPMQFGRNRTTKVMVQKIAVVWILSTAICSPVFIMGFIDKKNVYNNGICVPTIKEFVLYGSIIAFYIPLFVMVITHILTIRLLNANKSLMEGTRVKFDKKLSDARRRSTARTSESWDTPTGSSLILKLSISTNNDSNRQNMTNGNIKYGIQTSLLNGNDSPLIKTKKKLKEGANGKYATIAQLLHVPLQSDRPRSNKSQSDDSISDDSSAEINNSDEEANNSDTDKVNQNERRSSSLQITNIGEHFREACNDIKPKLSSQNNTKSNQEFKLTQNNMTKKRKFLKHRSTSNFFKKTSNERKATKVLSIIFSVFVIFWTPFFVLNILSVACEKCVENVMNTALEPLIVWLGWMASTANPIIYTIFNTAFRRAFVRILTCKSGYNHTHRLHSASCRPLYLQQKSQNL